MCHTTQKHWVRRGLYGLVLSQLITPILNAEDHQHSSADAAHSPVNSSESVADVLKQTALQHAEKHLNPTYVCPMHPQIVRGEEGTCPICGMDLVLKEVSTSEDDGLPIVTVKSAIVNNMGIRTATVTQGRLWKYIKTVGYVTYDEKRLSHVHPRAEGWVEKLKVRAEGDKVKKGQTLLSLYSPDILAAQKDLLISLKLKDQRGIQNNRYKAGTRNRLRLLGVPEWVIKHAIKTGKVQNTVPMTAPQSGIITNLGIREGMYITPTTQLFTIADLSSIWVQVEVYEHQLNWVKTGLTAEIKVDALPGKMWEGEVDYIYPELNPKTRTLKVRLRFNNLDGLLKPNMFAQAVIYGGAKTNVVKIPREALIETGERQSVVRALGEGRFQPVDVTVGMRSRDEVEILSGLTAEDSIVVSGQFLIDSEANLQASFRRLQQQ